MDNVAVGFKISIYLQANKEVCIGAGHRLIWIALIRETNGTDNTAVGYNALGAYLPATQIQCLCGPQADSNSPFQGRQLAVVLAVFVTKLNNLSTGYFSRQRKHDSRGVVVRCPLFGDREIETNPVYIRVGGVVQIATSSCFYITT